MKILLLFLPVILFCSPIGNPAAPHVLRGGFFIPSKCWLNVRGGYEGNFVFDAQMKQEEEGSGDVDTYSQVTNSGVAVINFLERLDLYGVFGTSKVSARWRFSDMTGRIRNAQMESSHDFLWAIGGRAILFSFCNWDLGLTTRYSALHSHLSWLTLDGLSSSVKGSRLRSRQWQMGLGVSYHIDLFTPYIGVNYLNTKTVLNHLLSPVADEGSRSDHFSNRIPVGLNLGCTLSSGKYFMLNLEALLINEEALAISGDFRF